ncbi:neprilysin-1-like [Amblyomma americanum]
MDPCHDLYDFVCGNYWGHPDGLYTQAEKDIRNTSISALHAETVPARMQSAWQKAAGLFQACYGFVTTYRNELEELKSLMVSLKLDLLNLRASRTVDPADMVVRLALDIGAPAVFDLKIYEDTFIDEKRLIQFKISDSQAAWHAKRAELKHRSSNKIEEYIHDRLLLYHGFEPDRDKSLVDTIYRFDETLTSTLTRHVKSHTEFTIRAIQNMGERMAPLVTPGQWTNLLAKYTNDVYNGGDMIQFQTQLLEGLMELLQVSYWGREGFRTMLAWGLFDAQVDYAMPQQLVGRKDKKVACYDLVLQVMEISVTSRYLRSKIYADTLSIAKDMFSKVQDAFEATLRGSSWLKGNGLDLVLRRLQMMKVLVGGPGPSLDESFVNNHYAAFPDMAPNGRFLDSWFQALSARANQKWADQTHVFFNTSMASPAYIKGSNAVVIPVGALLPILFYGDGNTALNYGTLGDALGQQIMNAFDLKAGARYCLSLEANERFSNKKLCVRQSHGQAGYPGSQSAENPRARPADVSDLVGIAMAYEVLRTLPSVHKTQTLPGVNLTAEQLFFVGHCMTTCKYDDRTPSGRFANPRARCNVPAMNMDAFSAAFGCGAAARMNPQRKCSFWK